MALLMAYGATSSEVKGSPSAGRGKRGKNYHNENMVTGNITWEELWLWVKECRQLSGRVLGKQITRPIVFLPSSPIPVPLIGCAQLKVKHPTETILTVHQPPGARAGQRSLDDGGGANGRGPGYLLNQEGFSDVERVSEQNKDYFIQPIKNYCNLKI